MVIEEAPMRSVTTRFWRRRRGHDLNHTRV